jgi:hypothetical protein
MKVTLVSLALIFTQNTFSQDLSDQELANQLMRKYERMMEKMFEDMKRFEQEHMNDYEKIMQQYLQGHFNDMQLSNSFYKWKDTKEARELIFSGELIDDGKANIEIKKKKIYIEGNFKQDYRGVATKRFVKITIPVPKDCDENKVSFKKTDKSLIMTFPKIKKIKTPSVKKDNVPVI